MKNLEVFIDYMRTHMKMKRQIIEKIKQETPEKSKDHRLQGQIDAYNSMIKELDECEKLMTQEITI